MASNLLETSDFKAVIQVTELQDIISDAILLLDGRLRIVESNPAASLMFGLDDWHLGGRPVQQLFSSSSHKSDLLHRYASLAGALKPSPAFELLTDSPNQAELPVEAHLLRRDRTTVWMVIRRLSEQSPAQLVAELRDCGRKLNRANRLKKDFLGRINHELRTPLHNLLGNCELLRAQSLGPLNEAQRGLLDDALGDAAKLLSIVGKLLDLSSLEAGQSDLKLEDFQVREEIDRVTARIHERASAKGIHVHSRVPIRSGVRADRERVFNLLMAVVDNAVKFTPDYGKVTITVAPRPGVLCVSVRDSGPGIPRSQHAAVLGGFYQLEVKPPGVREGLATGLSLARHLAELHGCKLWIANQHRKGAKVSFTLPSAGA